MKVGPWLGVHLCLVTDEQLYLSLLTVYFLLTEAEYEFLYCDWTAFPPVDASSLVSYSPGPGLVK